MAKCEVLDVRGYTEDGQVFGLTVPAYTRNVESFKAKVFELQSKYLHDSVGAQTLPSIADFALGLLAFAATEPREQEREG